MRRTYDYLLLALGVVLIAIAAAADVIGANTPPPRRELTAAGIWIPHPPQEPEANPAASIDGERGCLVLSDGRDFACDQRP